MKNVQSLEEWVDPRTSALLVVDIQNDFCHPEGAFAKRGFDVTPAQTMISKANELMASARKVGIPVIVIRNVRGRNTAWPSLERVSQVAYGPHWLPVFVEGTWGAELVHELDAKPGDIFLDKNRYGAFTGTNLHIILSNLGVETLVMTGCATNVCVESTLREGFMLGYNIVVVDDGCAATSQAFHDGTLATVRLWFGRVEHAGDVLSIWAESEATSRQPALP
jgi:ureidoacrylate peracid hydrolase